MSQFQIRLPATSANLGPGFDAVALALELYLAIDADAADAYSIKAVGRNVDVCTRLQRNLMLAVYEETLRAAGKPVRPLALALDNGIPIGMGCGSSAAARLGGISLANHFGELGWNSNRILQEACRLEGHPDNAAACWLGGFTVAAGSGEAMRAVSIDPPQGWAAILVLPDRPLATSAARALLPATYSRADAVTNIQNVALLTAAFQNGRADLLQLAMADRLHQPYRAQVCPLLPALTPLAGRAGILGVALSGAGPAVLALVEERDLAQATDAVERALPLQNTAEVLSTRLTCVFREKLPEITED
jgi:homoserine kinase